MSQNSYEGLLFATQGAKLSPHRRAPSKPQLGPCQDEILQYPNLACPDIVMKPLRWRHQLKSTQPRASKGFVVG